MSSGLFSNNVIDVESNRITKDYAYVNPVVAVFLGWALGGETVSARTLVASAVIVGAVVMITVERARAATARARPTSELPSEEPA